MIHFTMANINSFPQFMRQRIQVTRKAGKERTAEIYSTTLNSFERFLNGKDLLFKEVTQALICRYEDWLRDRDVTRNTIGFYMRALRSVYNQAVDRELTRQRNPFRHVYTGVDKTLKRAVSVSIIRRLKTMDLSREPQLGLARDLFLFSFYTRGMSFVDMAYLRPGDIADGILRYARRKTGVTLCVRWEPCMQEIVARYSADCGEFLLPIITNACKDFRRQYKTCLYRVNRALRRLSDRMGLDRPLTTYVARHSWASIAYGRRVPLSVIAEGMGHDSEKTTRIYLASIGDSRVDKANSMIIRSL